MSSQRKVILSGILMATLLVGCSTRKGHEIKTKQAALFFGAGSQSLIDQQYTDALASLLKANELEPNNSEILTNLAMAYYFKDQVDLAIKTLHRAIEINEENSDAHVNLASIYYRKKRYEDAEKIYKKVLTHLTYDKQARNLYNLGVLEMQIKKDFVTAESYFQKSVKEDENYCPSYYQLGLIKYQARKFNSAMRFFREATLGSCTDSAAAHFYQGMTLVQLRKFDEARLKFDEIETKFKKSIFAQKAREKSGSLTALETKQSKLEAHASRTLLNSPDF